MSDRTQFIATIGILALLFGSYIGALGLVAYYDRKEREKRGEPPRYDERQRMVRLRAGNRALAALIAYLVLWTILNQLDYPWAQNIWSMLFCALFLVWGVWAAYCILHDGLIGWKEQKDFPESLVLSYTWLLFLPANGLRSTGAGSWLPLIFVAVDEAVLCFVVLYKRRKRKLAEREEDAL